MAHDVAATTLVWFPGRAFRGRARDSPVQRYLGTIFVNDFNYLGRTYPVRGAPVTSYREGQSKTRAPRWSP